ncbi:hypothetical protein [Vreelandella populi]|uniref:DUF7940 domain-containing protein n=1 Tax=Vreelandella populi TaxID=2498858 RepID=UPI000F8F7829|nr:hypothetical protein [Halomonas populi]RUR38534.1 hypothetical protein ELY25_09225 [Halomonas populi]
MKLSDDAPVWHRLWSNQAALLSAITILQGLLPFWNGIVPDRWFMIGGAVLSTGAFILRNIEQPKLKAELAEKRQSNA